MFEVGVGFLYFVFVVKVSFLSSFSEELVRFEGIWISGFGFDSVAWKDLLLLFKVEMKFELRFELTLLRLLLGVIFTLIVFRLFKVLFI